MSWASSSTVRTGKKPSCSLYSHGRVHKVRKGDNYFNDDALGKYQPRSTKSPDDTFALFNEEKGKNANV